MKVVVLFGNELDTWAAEKPQSDERLKQDIQQLMRHVRGPFPFAPSMQPLTCEVNVNFAQTTLSPVKCQSENGLGTVGCESCPVEQRVRGSTNRLQA